MKKLLVLAAVIIMVLSMITACAKQPETTEPTAAPGDAVEPVATDEPAEPVTITIFQRGAIDYDQENIIEKFLEEQTNIQIERILATDDQNPRIQTAIATGDAFADIMHYWDDMSAVVSGAQSGFIIPLTDFISEEKTPNIMKYVPAGAWAATKVLAAEGDTNIYMIPKPIFNRSTGVIVRKDWLEAVGYTQSADYTMTMEDFFTLLDKFTNEDPDGNGEKDTYGITTNAAFMEKGADLFKPYFGLNGWQPSTTGEYEYMNPEYDLNDDVMIDFLDTCSRLWTEGLIDPNAPNNVGDPNLALVRYAQGIAGFYSTGTNNMESIRQQLQADNPNGTLSYVTRIVQEPGVYEPAAGIGTGTWSELLVTKAAVGKEAAIMKYLEFYLGDTGWTFLQDNWSQVTTPWTIDLLGRGIYFPGEYAGPTDADEETKALYATWADGITRNLVTSMDIGYSTNVSKEQAFLDHQEMRKQIITKIITGELPSSEYYVFLQDWYDNGFYAEHAAEMNEYIKSLQ